MLTEKPGQEQTAVRDHAFFLAANMSAIGNSLEPLTQTNEALERMNLQADQLARAIISALTVSTKVK